MNTCFITPHRAPQVRAHGQVAMGRTKTTILQYINIIPSGNLIHIAIETGHLHLTYRVKTVIFHSYVDVYQRAMGN